MKFPTLEGVNTTGFDALNRFIEDAAAEESSPALADALAHAEEFALPTPDAATGALLTTLVASATGHSSAEDGATRDKAQAIAITPASSVVGLHLLAGLPESGIVTCIDPEAEHHNHAKQTFREAGYPPSRVRFLPSRPLDVMGRLANDAYQLIYVDSDIVDYPALVSAAWPLLSKRGTVVLAGSLLDGTVADESRKDRATDAAREADAAVAKLDGAHVTRLPLGSGLTLVTKL